MDNKNKKWWFRLAKVIYILMYIPLAILLPGVWTINDSEWLGYSINGGVYKDTPGKALIYSIIALVIYLGLMKLIKMAFLYISFGEKPNWKKEFTSFT